MTTIRRGDRVRRHGWIPTKRECLVLDVNDDTLTLWASDIDDTIAYPFRPDEWELVYTLEEMMGVRQ